MAYMYPPGHSLGPCIGACQCDNCATVREVVSRKCIKCRKLIGYKKNFTQADDFVEGSTHPRLVVHRACCTVDEYEKLEAAQCCTLHKEAIDMAKKTAKKSGKVVKVGSSKAKVAPAKVATEEVTRFSKHRPLGRSNGKNLMDTIVELFKWNMAKGHLDHAALCAKLGKEFPQRQWTAHDIEVWRMRYNRGACVGQDGPPKTRILSFDTDGNAIAARDFSGSKPSGRPNAKPSKATKVKTKAKPSKVAVVKLKVKRKAS